MDYAGRMRACQHGTSPEHDAGSKISSGALCAAVSQLGKPTAAAAVRVQTLTFNGCCGCVVDVLDGDAVVLVLRGVAHGSRRPRAIHGPLEVVILTMSSTKCVALSTIKEGFG